MLYRIGEFASQCGLTVKTLRYYDEIGLLKPVKVDDFTGYRYYSDRQLDDVELIKILKTCGFTLEEIAATWGNLTTAVINAKKTELLRHIQDVMNQIETLEFLNEKSQEFGIGEESLEHANNSKDMKLLTKTPKPVTHA